MSCGAYYNVWVRNDRLSRRTHWHLKPWTIKLLWSPGCRGLSTGQLWLCFGSVSQIAFHLGDHGCQPQPRVRQRMLVGRERIGHRGKDRALSASTQPTWEFLHRKTPGKSGNKMPTGAKVALEPGVGGPHQRHLDSPGLRVGASTTRNSKIICGRNVTVREGGDTHSVQLKCKVCPWRMWLQSITAQNEQLP